MATSIKVKRSAVAGRIPTTADLELGEIALNTYDGVAYIKKNVGGTETVVQIGGAQQGLQNRYQYTATAGQTTFAASYTAPYVDVYLNGIRLIAGTDYTATNGTSVVLASGASLNNTVEIVGYNALTVQTAFDNLPSYVVTVDGTQTLTNKTITETVYTLAGTNISATNGSMQVKTLSGPVTFTESLSNGQSVLLRLVNASTYAVTWFSVTWVSSSGNVAPTLANDCHVVFWKTGSVVYGAYVGRSV